MMKMWGLVASFELRGASSRDATHRTAFAKVVASYELRGASRKSIFATRNSQLATRNAITLIEILISLFVLLFGLMGVAAIFPVASHYLVQGDQKARSGALAINAFAEIGARGLLDPHKWLYSSDTPEAEGVPLNGVSPIYPSVSNIYPLVSPLVIQDEFGGAPGMFNVPISTATGPGHVFVIDSMSASSVIGQSNLDIWPMDSDGSGNPIRRLNLWNSGSNPDYPGSAMQLSGGWPVRRVTLQVHSPATSLTIKSFLPMTTNTAETIFRLRDDLAVELPDQGDRPAMQRWSVDNNGTPNDFSDDTFLARQYQGDYSWLATVVPVDNNALLGLQPAANLDGGLYDVSVVVFYKRDTVPSASAAGSPGSERLIAAEFLNQGELALYDAFPGDDETLETALEDIRPTNWICVMGVNQTNGQFMMRWYRILAMEEETDDVVLNSTGSPVQGRLLMVSEGGAWPAGPDDGSGNPLGWQNLQVAILPGAIHVQTRQLPLSCECCE